MLNTGTGLLKSCDFTPRIYPPYFPTPEALPLNAVKPPDCIDDQASHAVEKGIPQHAFYMCTCTYWYLYNSLTMDKQKYAILTLG